MMVEREAATAANQPIAKPERFQLMATPLSMARKRLLQLPHTQHCRPQPDKDQTQAQHRLGNVATDSNLFTLFIAPAANA